MAGKKKADKVEIKVSGVVSNGQGGFFREGTDVSDLPKETLDSLKAKGYV